MYIAKFCLVVLAGLTGIDLCIANPVLLQRDSTTHPLAPLLNFRDVGDSVNEAAAERMKLSGDSSSKDAVPIQTGLLFRSSRPGKTAASRGPESSSLLTICHRYGARA
jgi:hypothetical protein